MTWRISLAALYHRRGEVDKNLPQRFFDLRALSIAEKIELFPDTSFPVVILAIDNLCLFRISVSLHRANLRSKAP